VRLQRHVNIVYIPIAHCHFNPIELFWAQVKGYCKTMNSTFSLKDVEGHLRQFCSAADVPARWEKVYRHTSKVVATWRADDESREAERDAAVPVAVAQNRA